MIVTVIGRGHSGTRAMSHTLSASGFYMGAGLNESGDLVPAAAMYEACRVFARHVVYRGNCQWDFERLHTMPIDPAFRRLVEEYLASVLASDAPDKGWKLPETILCFPWIVRLFPQIHYILGTRSPRLDRWQSYYRRPCRLWCALRSHRRRARAPGDQLEVPGGHLQRHAVPASSAPGTLRRLCTRPASHPRPAGRLPGSAHDHDPGAPGIRRTLANRDWPPHLSLLS